MLRLCSRAHVKSFVWSIICKPRVKCKFLCAASTMTPLLTSYTAAAQVTLAWDASVSMVDGYWLYYGTQPGSYTTRIDVGTATTYTVAGITAFWLLLSSGNEPG